MCKATHRVTVGGLIHPVATFKELLLMGGLSTAFEPESTEIQTGNPQRPDLTLPGSELLDRELFTHIIGLCRAPRTEAGAPGPKRGTADGEA